MAACTCKTEDAGTRNEYRVLDRSCPVHGDAADAARRQESVGHAARNRARSVWFRRGGERR